MGPLARTLGVDPGVVGGWAIVDEAGQLLAAGDLPTAGEGARHMVSGALLRAIIDEWKPDAAVVEWVWAMPKQGSSSGFKFGKAAGVVEGSIGALLIPMSWVTSTTWKKAFRLPSDKEPSRQLAIQTWPHMAKLFTRKKDHGRAEAALIALYHHETRRAHAAADVKL